MPEEVEAWMTCSWGKEGGSNLNLPFPPPPCRSGQFLTPIGDWGTWSLLQPKKKISTP